MGVFADIASQEEQTQQEEQSIFPDRPPVHLPNTDKQMKTTSALSAFAEMDVRQDESLDEIFKSNETQIRAGGEDALRTRISNQRKHARLEAVQGLQLELMDTGLPAPQELRVLIEHEMDIRNAAEQKDALEQVAVEAIQNSAAEDPFQAAMMENLQEQGTALDRVVDHLVKGLKFNKKQDELLKELGDQGTAKTLFDLLALPLQEQFNILKSAPKAAADWQNTVQSLWNLQRDNGDYDAALDKFFEDVRANSGIFTENLSLAANVAETYRGVSKQDSLELSLWTSVEAATLIPFGRIVQLVRNPSRLLHAAGARSQSSSLTASTLFRGKIDDEAFAAFEAAERAARKPAAGEIPSGQKRLTGPAAPEGPAPKAGPPARPPAEPGISGVANIDDAITDSMARSMIGKRPELSRDYIGIMGDVTRDFDAMDQFARQFDEVVLPDRLSPDGTALTIDMEMARIRRRFSEERIVDISDSVDKPTRLRMLHYTLGKRSGGGWLTEGGAEQGAKDLGLDLQSPDIKIERGLEGQWFLEVTSPVPETGVINPTLTAEQLPPAGIIGKYLRDPNNYLAEFLGEANSLSNLAQTQLKKELIPTAKILNKLSSGQRKTMDNIWEVGRQNRKWFTAAELDDEFLRMTGELPNAKETAAYYAGKYLSDIEHRMRNRNVYIELAREGYETVTINNAITGFRTPRMNGRIIENPQHSEMRLYDVEDDAWHPRGTGNDIVQAKLDTEDYHIIELHNPAAANVTRNGDSVRHVLVRRGDVTRAPLETQQVNYLGGGHTLYVTKLFAKQANVHKFSAVAGGGEELLDPHSFYTGFTGSEVDEWVRRAEIARQHYVLFKDGVITRALAASKIDNTTFETIEHMDDLVRDGLFTPRQPIEMVSDQGLPSAYDAAGATSQYFDPNRSGLVQHQSSNGGMYYGERGHGLLSKVDGQRVTLNPTATLDKAVNNAIQQRTFHSYIIRSMEEWVKTASPHFEGGTVNSGMSTAAMFNKARLSENLRINKSGIFTTLEVNRDTIKRLIGYKTAGQRFKEATWQRFARALDADALGKPGQELSKRVLNLADRNPANAVASMVFDRFLGFFDPGQFLLQSQAAFSAATISPEFGINAVKNYRAMRHMQAVWAKDRDSPAFENLLDLYATRMSSELAQDPSDFKDMVRAYLTSGHSDPSSDVVLHTLNPDGIGNSKVIRAAKKARGVARTPFLEGDITNRIVSWQIAWRETKKVRPDEDVTEPNFRGRVGARAQDFNFGMSKASAAFWQQGTLKIPTQFFSFMARSLETVLPGKIGNPRFTTAQKWKLAAGQLIMYGTRGAGLGGVVYGGGSVVDYMIDQYEEHTGERPTDEQYRVLTKGFWDWMFFTASGGELDTDFARRAAVAEGLWRIAETMQAGEYNSVLTVAGGAGGDTGGDIADSILRLSRYYKGPVTPPASALFDLIGQELVKNISSLSRASKADWVWRTGNLVNPRTGEKIVDATKLEGFAVLLGIPLRQETANWDIGDELSDAETLIKEIGGMAAVHERLYWQAVADGDKQEMEVQSLFKQAILSPYKDDAVLQQRMIERMVTVLNWNETRWRRNVDKLMELTGEEPRGGR